MLADPAQAFTVDPITTVRLALSSSYEIIEEIGRGGMAVVYKAQQKSLGRIVALKVLPQQFTHDIEFLERFHREAKESARLNHPNIVKVYTEGVENGVHFIAMEYLDGTDLLALVRRQGRLDVSRAIALLAPICDALHLAHENGVIHRDVKTANIIVTSEGRPVLMDFGIAHAARASKLTQTGTLLGTPEYMSPEQAQGIQVDGRSDLYSLGVVLYECLTGRVPFSGPNPVATVHEVIHARATSLSQLNSDVPPWLEAVVMRLLAKRGDDRYATGGDAAKALRGAPEESNRRTRSAPQKDGKASSPADVRPVGRGPVQARSTPAPARSQQHGSSPASSRTHSKRPALGPEAFILLAGIIVVIALIWVISNRQTTVSAVTPPAVARPTMSSSEQTVQLQASDQLRRQQNEAALRVQQQEAERRRIDNFNRVLTNAERLLRDYEWDAALAKLTEAHEIISSDDRAANPKQKVLKAIISVADRKMDAGERVDAAGLYRRAFDMDSADNTLRVKLLKAEGQE
jgi:serine/threonine protein kinase